MDSVEEFLVPSKPEKLDLIHQVKEEACRGRLFLGAKGMAQQLETFHRWQLWPNPDELKDSFQGRTREELGAPMHSWDLSVVISSGSQ